MATQASTRHDTRWSAQRITGMAGTFAVHVAAVAMLALPGTAPVAAVREVVATTITMHEKPPEPVMLPPPPEPQPRPRPRREPVPVARPQPIPIVAEATTSMPVPPVADVIDEGPAIVDAPVADPGPGTSAGANVTLAYAALVQPSYPDASRKKGEQGTVLLRVLVDVEGRVDTIEVARSSGSQRLDRAARDAVQKSRFRPVIVDGVPRPAWGLVPIAFTIDRG
ncbi:energy transducer TonB [Dokdonella sp. MW10]|uniref:energy transducer TonB n=1 Tax=Dokdonella sp. MW10 TaxID=2992926 RepID=UPI003F80DA65